MLVLSFMRHLHLMGSCLPPDNNTSCNLLLYAPPSRLMNIGILLFTISTLILTNYKITTQYVVPNRSVSRTMCSLCIAA